MPKLTPHARSFALLALVLVSALLVALARARAPAIDLGVADERLSGPAFSSGIYAREYGADGAPYRWTSGSAVVQLRGAGNAAPAYLVRVQLRAEHPSAPQPLAFLLNGRQVAVAVPAAELRSYRLLAPAASDGELTLNLRTASFVAAGNPRELGVVLGALELRPLPAADWPAAALAALGLLALWAAMARRGAAPGHVAAALALSGAGLALAAALYRPAPLPYALLAALFLIAAITSVFLVEIADAAGWRSPALLLLLLIVSFSGVIWPSWISDDAFISFRYAQNLAQGHGMVYNEGERVEGYTNFLWTLIAAGLIRLGGDIVLWSYLSGVALGLAILLLSYRLAARLAGPGWGLVAAIAVSSSQSLLIYTARGAGLETGLFTLLVLAGSGLYLRAAGRPGLLAAAGAALALAAMTRPEGVMVFAITLGHLTLIGPMNAERRTTDGRRYWPLLVGRWPLLIALAGSFLLIFVPYYLWRLGYYGDPLPNTFYAKTGGGLAQIVRGLQYAGGFALTLGGPLLLLIFVPWLRSWRAALGSWRGYLLGLTLVYSAYIVAVGGDHFRGERFFVPLLPWLAILLADGLSALLPARPGWPLRAGLAGLLCLGGAAALARSAPFDETIAGVDESVWIWREIGWWVADNGPPDSSLAALGAGAVAYYSQRPVIDLLGLTEKHIARVSVAEMGTGTAGHEKRDPGYVLAVRQPTYIPQIWDDYFGGAAGLRDDYDLVTVVTRSGRELGMWVRREARGGPGSP